MSDKNVSASSPGGDIGIAVQNDIVWEQKAAMDETAVESFPA